MQSRGKEEGTEYLCVYAIMLCVRCMRSGVVLKGVWERDLDDDSVCCRSGWNYWVCKASFGLRVFLASMVSWRHFEIQTLNNDSLGHPIIL